MLYVLLTEHNAKLFKTVRTNISMAEIDSNIFSKVVLESSKHLSSVIELKTRRDLYDHISEPTDYFVGLKGLRGVGKTTLLLQLATRYKNPIYFSADAVYLGNTSIYDLVKHAVQNGHDSFFIDEIHYKKNWTYDLKTLYDEGVRNLFFSGSSAIELKKGADLSRRVVLYTLPPATFKEYLLIKKGIALPSLTLRELIEKRKDILQKYSEAYTYFEEYLAYGGFLYDRKEFDLKLLNSIQKIASVDLAYLRDININVESDVIKIFNLISTTASFELNYSKLSNSLGLSRNTTMKLLADMEKAGCVFICSPCKKGYALIRNEPKIFLPIPFTSFFSRQLVYAPNIGRLREEFFISHINKVCYLKTDRGKKTADFNVGEYTIEIGGVSKSSIQNPDYIAVDGLEISENKIPLFLFGFLRFVQ